MLSSSSYSSTSSPSFSRYSLSRESCGTNRRETQWCCDRHWKLAADEQAASHVIPNDLLRLSDDRTAEHRSETQKHYEAALMRISMRKSDNLLPNLFEYAIKWNSALKSTDPSWLRQNRSRKGLIALLINCWSVARNRFFFFCYTPTFSKNRFGDAFQARWNATRTLRIWGRDQTLIPN